MAKFPMRFEVYSDATSEVTCSWKLQSNSKEPICCSVPVEFGGPGGGYTPEDLFALSVISCITSAFKVNCEKKGESFKKVSMKAALTMNEGPEGLHFPEIDIKVDVTGASDIEKVKTLLEEASKNCPVSNSIKSAKILHIKVS